MSNQVRLLRNNSHYRFVLSEQSSQAAQKYFSYLCLRKKRQIEMCVHCVLAVLIKQTDPFYDFAVGDKWEEK